MCVEAEIKAWRGKTEIGAVIEALFIMRLRIETRVSVMRSQQSITRGIWRRANFNYAPQIGNTEMYMRKSHHSIRENASHNSMKMNDARPSLNRHRQIFLFICPARKAEL